MLEKDENVDRLEIAIEKLSKTVEKLTDFSTDFLSRIAVIESKYQRYDVLDSTVNMRIGEMEKKFSRMIYDEKKSINDVEQKIATMTIINSQLNENVKSIKENLDSKFVSKDMFDPIKRIVYAVSGSIMLGVVGSIINLILKK